MKEKRKTRKKRNKILVDHKINVNILYKLFFSKNNFLLDFGIAGKFQPNEY